MRTTLNIADDVLTAVKEVAKREAKPIGTVVSRLIRQSLLGEGGGAAARSAAEPPPEFGFRPFPKRGGIVTNELVNQLREEAGD